MRSWAAWLLLASGLAAAPVRPAGLTLAHAEALVARLPAGDPWERIPDGSTLAWGEAATLHALLDLFEASGDGRYLADVARRGDRLLTHRDDRRGVVDGSGKSRPAWSMGSRYAVAEAVLVDAAGAPALRVRSAPNNFNDQTRLEVVAESRARFTLRVSNAHFRREETFAGLSLDPADTRFAVRVVNSSEPFATPRAGSGTGPSQLVRVEVASGGRVPPDAQSLMLRPIPLAFNGYLGVIYHPLMRFAERVRGIPGDAALTAAAGRFVVAAEESYADLHRRLWRDGPGEGEGTYLTCEPGESFPYDNVGLPFNFLGRHTAVELALHRLTGRAEYRDKATRMTQLFLRRLRRDVARDLYTWNYWYEPITTTGWRPPDGPSRNIPWLKPIAIVEDISHGALDIALVVEAHRAGVLVTETDLLRFARTLRLNVLTPDRSSVLRRVDGQGGVHADYVPALAGWLELAGSDPEVYREIRRVAEAVQTSDLGLIAALLKWERRLSAR